MTREDIIRMAAEVWTTGSFYPIPSSDDIERFAALVAASEREEIADDLEYGFIDDEGHHIQYAAAIRERGEKK